jgi:hypothetical protein
MYHDTRQEFIIVWRSLHDAKRLHVQSITTHLKETNRILHQATQYMHMYF